MAFQEILNQQKNKFIEVFTKDGLLLIKKIQKDNSKILTAEDFITLY